MNIRAHQRLLLRNGDYKGGHDGDEGPAMRGAIDRVLKRNRAKLPFNPDRASAKRRRTAASQLILTALGYPVGKPDGLMGHLTADANDHFNYWIASGRKFVIKQTPIKTERPVVTTARNGSRIPLQSECNRVYGTPGKNTGTIRKRLVTVNVPYPLKYGRQKVTRVTVHKMVADSLIAAFTEVLEHYGIERIRKLGLDVYGGTYNPRKMRGGNRWSMHAYGIAIDMHPAGNGLKTRCPQALFCKPEYKAFLDIMEKHSWLPAIRLWGADAMHFQVARLR